VAVFVDGRLWHGYPLHPVKPKNNAGFWERKLCGNRERDKQVSLRLREENWTVIKIWEHEVESDLGGVMDQLFNLLRKKLQNLGTRKS
jgi:DNA mismatch endonuclease (patch repair protein)